jgi:hypothetical protein
VRGLARDAASPFAGAVLFPWTGVLGHKTRFRSERTESVNQDQCGCERASRRKVNTSMGMTWSMWDRMRKVGG